MIVAGPLWTVAVNRNQNLIGKTMLVANRRVESVTALHQDEWLDLHRQISRVTVALDRLFRPDQYNHRQASPGTRGLSDGEGFHSGRAGSAQLSRGG